MADIDSMYYISYQRVTIVTRAPPGVPNITTNSRLINGGRWVFTQDEAANSSLLYYIFQRPNRRGGRGMCTIRTKNIIRHHLRRLFPLAWDIWLEQGWFMPNRYYLTEEDLEAQLPQHLHLRQRRARHSARGP